MDISLKYGEEEVNRKIDKEFFLLLSYLSASSLKIEDVVMLAAIGGVLLDIITEGGNITSSDGFLFKGKENVTDFINHTNSTLDS